MCVLGSGCRAFCDAFTIHDDVSLIIHTNLNGKFDKSNLTMDAIRKYIDLEVVGKTQHR